MKKVILLAIFAVFTTATYAQLKLRSEYGGCTMFYSAYVFEFEIVTVDTVTSADSITIGYRLESTNMTNVSGRIENRPGIQITDGNYSSTNVMNVSLMNAIFGKCIFIRTLNPYGQISFRKEYTLNEVRISIMGERPNNKGRIVLSFNMNIASTGKVTLLEKKILGARSARYTYQQQGNQPPCPSYPEYN